MKWVYLSPHLDDAVYSCGALMDQQVKQGLQVEIWTLFAGQFDARKLSTFAKEIHQRWGTGLLSVQARRLEDQKACTFLGVVPKYYNFQDVIYRHTADDNPEIVFNDDLFRNYQSGDELIKEKIKSALGNALDELVDIQVCAPLGLGNHIDHQILRKAIDEIELKNPLYYYADFPYVIREKVAVSQEHTRQYQLAEENVKVWCKAIAIYKSQISTFWDEEKEICEEINPYWQNGGGSCLWISEQ
jgi:LmbE family N-acetylglucosaminyl deacetylase